MISRSASVISRVIRSWTTPKNLAGGVQSVSLPQPATEPHQAEGNDVRVHSYHHSSSFAQVAVNTADYWTTVDIVSGNRGLLGMTLRPDTISIDIRLHSNGGCDGDSGH